jgi:hypothetical protein
VANSVSALQLSQHQPHKLGLFAAPAQALLPHLPGQFCGAVPCCMCQSHSAHLSHQQTVSGTTACAGLTMSGCSGAAVLMAPGLPSKKRSGAR